MRKVLKIAVIGALAGLVGGCAGSPGGVARANLAATSLDDLFGAQDLDDGKAALRQGQTSLAITAFRRAAINPRTAGEAANGLGIAYARLGRTDLAEVQFAKAIALAPDDARFLANLSRLYRSDAGERLLAHRQAQAARQFVRAEAIAAARQNANGNSVGPIRRGALTFESTGSRILRKDGKEVLLTTRDAGGSKASPALAALVPGGRKPSNELFLGDIRASRQTPSTNFAPASAASATSVRKAGEMRIGSGANVQRPSERLRVRLPVDADY